MSMMVVVVYDISTVTAEGARRLRRIRKVCADFGIAVQSSVFECECSAQQFQDFKARLQKMICPDCDSIRFYLLGKHYQSRMEYLGRQKKIADRESYVL